MSLCRFAQPLATDASEYILQSLCLTRQLELNSSSRVLSLRHFCARLHGYGCEVQHFATVDIKFKSGDLTRRTSHQENKPPGVRKRKGSRDVLSRTRTARRDREMHTRTVALNPNHPASRCRPVYMRAHKNLQYKEDE